MSHTRSVVSAAVLHDTRESTRLKDSQQVSVGGTFGGIRLSAYLGGPCALWDWLFCSVPVPTIDCVDAIRFDEGVKNPREIQRSRVFYWSGVAIDAGLRRWPGREECRRLSRVRKSPARRPRPRPARSHSSFPTPRARHTAGRFPPVARACRTASPPHS